MTTMAAQFITVEFFITQYVSQIGGRGVAFSIPPGTVKIGPWVIQSDTEVYYLMVVLVVSVYLDHGQSSPLEDRPSLDCHSR